MKQLLFLVFIACSLNVGAQKKQGAPDSLLIIKAPVAYYNALIQEYLVVARLDELINSIYQQVVPQIQNKPK